MCELFPIGWELGFDECDHVVRVRGVTCWFRCECNRGGSGIGGKKKMRDEV